MVGALASPRTRDKRGHEPGRRKRANTQIMHSEEMECKEWNPKGPCIIHAARVKQIPAHAAELDKHKGNGKCVKTKKVMDSGGSRTCTQGSGTTYCTQLIQGRWATGQRYERGCGLAVGRRRGPILGFPLKLFWREMSCWYDISPKRSKHELESLDACHIGR